MKFILNFLNKVGAVIMRFINKHSTGTVTNKEETEQVVKEYNELKEKAKQNPNKEQ